MEICNTNQPKAINPNNVKPKAITKEIKDLNPNLEMMTSHN